MLKAGNVWEIASLNGAFKVNQPLGVEERLQWELEVNMLDYDNRKLKQGTSLNHN